EVSLIADGRSMGELKQGVTTQIFGEGSMGPLTDEMKKHRMDQQGDIKYEIAWTTLAEYLTYLEKRGVSQNFASFIGAPTIREYVIGLEDKPPTPGQANWPKLDQVIAMIEDARRQGLKITADMYTYTAGATGLNSCMPPWVYDGGAEAAYKRLQDPETRKKIADAMRTPSKDWENLYMLAGSPD